MNKYKILYVDEGETELSIRKVGAGETKGGIVYRTGDRDDHGMRHGHVKGEVTAQNTVEALDIFWGMYNEIMEVANE